MRNICEIQKCTACCPKCREAELWWDDDPTTKPPKDVPVHCDCGWKGTADEVSILEFYN